MGRTPEGEQALSGAERQARYRLRHGLLKHGAIAGDGGTKAAPRRLPRGPGLMQRWDSAVAAVVAVRAEYARWLEALPEATRDTATGQALQDMVDLDLDEIIAIRPPRGFGRD